MYLPARWRIHLLNIHCIPKTCGTSDDKMVQLVGGWKSCKASDDTWGDKTVIFDIFDEETPKNTHSTKKRQDILPIYTHRQKPDGITIRKAPKLKPLAYLIFVHSINSSASVKKLTEGNFVFTINAKRTPDSVLLYTVCYFTHNMSFYTQCVILLTVCNFTHIV